MCNIDLELVWPWPFFLSIKFIFYRFLFAIHQKAQKKFIVGRVKLTFETHHAIDMSNGPI